MNYVYILLKRNLPMIKHFKLKIAGLLLFTTSLNYAQFTDEINSNRPGKSHGAFSVGKTVIQAEAGTYYINDKHKYLGYKSSGFGGELSLRYGAFLEQLEFIADIQYQFDSYKTDYYDTNRNGIRQATIGAKYLVYDPFKNHEEKVNIYSWKANHRFKWRQFVPAVGVYVGANFGASNIYRYPDEPSFSPKAMLITQNHFGTQWVLVGNFIADKFTSDYSSYGYVLTLTRGINEKWSAFIENQGYQSDYYSDVIFRGGAAYLLRKNLQIDASIGANIKDTPSLVIGGIGFSWRFDKNYKPIEIKSGKEEKGKKDGKKEEKKKRVDEIETQ